MVLVRNFKPEDLEKVKLIAEVSLKEEYDDRLFLSIHSAWNAGFLVAVNNRVLTGYICGTINKDDSARILMLAVHPLYRRQGIGSTLMDAFMDQCLREGTKMVTLEVRPTNHVATNFYRNRGFKPVGLIEDFYSNGEDGLKMVKYL